MTHCHRRRGVRYELIAGPRWQDVRREFADHRPVRPHLPYVPATQNGKVIDPDAQVFEDDEED